MAKSDKNKSKTTNKISTNNTMKFVSWNVNGLRAVLKKDFLDVVKNMNADIFALQETKCKSDQVDIDLAGYEQIFSSAEKAGYSGTAVFVKEKPLQVINHIFSEDERNDDEEIMALDTEGRIIALEFENYWFVCCYTPNAKNELLRIGPRMKWGEQFAKFCKGLEAGIIISDESLSACSTKVHPKPVIICGDLNVAHNEIDLKNPKSNRGNAGFSDEERQDFTNLLNTGFIDTFRFLYPDLEDAYSWWSYRFNARARNAGWRIDYFLISDFIDDRLVDSKIHSEILGSDHCPVSLEVNI